MKTGLVPGFGGVDFQEKLRSEIYILPYRKPTLVGELSILRRSR